MQIEKIKTPSELEQYVRASLLKKDDLNLEKFYSSDLGIIFEGLKVQHKCACKKKQCFCKRYENMEKNKKQDCKEKKRFLIKFIDKLFEQHLKMRKKEKNFDKNFLIIYCSFIIEILRCPVKSYVYLLLLEQDRDTQSLEQRVLSYLLQRKAKVQFEQYLKFEEYNHFEQSLIFCEQIDNFKERFKAFIIKKSQKLQQYAFIFANIYDLKRQKFKRNLSKIYKKITLQMIKIVQKSYEIFHKQTGVVFVSLLNPLGKIKRASKNLLKIFGYNFKELYDQSINILMPPAIGKHHDKILQFYISKGVEHPTEIKDMNKFLLGTDDFGLNVLFQVKSCNSEFIYFDKIQISSYRNNHSSQEQILVSFTNLDAEPPCVFNDNYQNPGSQNNGVMNQQQKDGNNSKMKNSVSKNAPTEEKNEQEIEEQNQKIFKSLGYCISNITPSAYVEIFLRCGIDFEKVRQMNFRKLIPLMYLDLEIGRQYKTVFILPKSEVLNKFYQVKSDAYVVKNKQIVSLFKLLDESSENDYDVFDFSFKILKQVAINAQEFFYLEICEYQKIEKAFDSFTLINEVKQIICNITKIKLPKSQKYQIYNKTKLKVSSMLEKIKEKNSKNATKLSDPYQTQFVQNNIILSDSVSSEDSDEEQYTINEGKKYSQDNEAEILQNLLGENIHTNDITEMSEMAEVPQLTQNMNSLSLSPIKLQNLIDKDSIEESKLDEIFELKLENQNQNLENIQNGKQSIFKQEMNMQIQKANNQAYSKLNNQNSLTNQNFENNLNQKYLKSFNKQLSFQKQAVKNHKQLIKRKSVQQKFFKSQPSNILSFASIMKEKSSELHHLNFTKNLSQTRNSQKLANLQQNNQQQNRNQSPRSEVPSESSQDKKLDDNEDDNDNSDDSDLKKDNKNLSKKKRQLFLNLDQSQDNLNISVDISEMLNDYVVSQINDKASASSFRNEFNALKRKIINYIFDLSKHALIYSILIFGIVSYLFFLTMTFVTYIIVNQSFTSQVDSIDQLSYSSLLVESHLYVAMIGQLMVNYNLELSSYSLNQTRIEQLFAVIYNQVLNQSILNADDSVTYVQNLLKFGFILIETVSILSLLFVIPLYLAIQQQREIILKLFSNLTREKIENIILQIDQFLTFISQKQSNEKSSFYSTKNNYKSIENIQWKKRASSTTSNLKKCKTYLIVSGFVILLVVSVYPCVNFFYTNNFLSNYSKLIDEYVSLVRIKNLNLIKQTVLYSQIHQTIGTQQQIKDIIFNFEQTIAEETLKLQGLQQIKGDFDKSSGSQISQYENIFINPLSENICNLIDTNQLPIYSIDSNITQIEGCDQVWSGILQSGILVANIELFTQQDSIQKILVASNSNRALFIENFKKWESVDKTLNEFDKLLYWINAVYKTIQYQAQNENKSQFQLIKEVQLILLLIAIVLITIIYLVLWNIFIFTIYKEFIYTKQSLSLLHSSLIMENNYFLSFLKNQKLN
ncbi:transmembrane protein, putative (macronuclear) [Tetrahymena thermophila SB210]|uniref:Transmembrane protein, putative n=1 Tax=Tetrahymena thermophila (strain SB210) TaxID=312017 RepID=Q23EE0_TETTS|nr:transmembrane protein, putative [Tetrahymena thermophila SB210]EAR94917.2 transmembrane protein, putative [Tetrahymena thermophila SB210]|eukprot:XP_001015162.2 transmembrane protein, putative [Tetrahymena thermophila SB210]